MSTPPLQKPGPTEFLLLGVLATFWGTAFMFTKTAVSDYGPFTLAASRVAIAALILFTCLVFTGRRFPRDRNDWIWIIAGSATGTILPFTALAWGQQSLDSSLTAVLMATTPLSTLLLAHVMTDDEKMTRTKVVGMICGFIGMLVVIGPISIGDVGGLPPAAVLLGAFGYAISGLFYRRVRHADAIESGASVMVFASIPLIPIALIVEKPFSVDSSLLAKLSLLELGIFPTALAMIFLVTLLRRSGATLVATTTYLVPIIGLTSGAIFLGEPLSLSALVGFGLILTGVAISTGLTKRLTRGRSGARAPQSPPKPGQSQPH